MAKTDLIITHVNADFDALSSVVAVRKLYPEASIIVPGSQERSVRNFLALIKDRFGIEDESTFDFTKVKRLIIVDNRHASRIGKAACLLEREDVEVHIYDHHPRMKNDIKADKEAFREVGATVTLILHLLDENGLFNVTPLEATLMLLGIYEETGSLSYSMTTKMDVDIVSRLLSEGARLAAVSSYLNRELSGKELSLLMALIRNIRSVNIKGLDIAFTRVDVSDFDGELGTVIHRLQEIENYPAVFAMFTRGEKIKVLARSRGGSVNVNRLLSFFGGGGHSSAASCRVRQVTPYELERKIRSLLRSFLEEEVTAAKIMSEPPRLVYGNDKVGKVLKQLERTGQDAAVVMDHGKRVIGIAKKLNLKKALKNNMAHSMVKGYITAPAVTVTPETPLHELKRILLEEDTGVIPVVEGERLVGIIDRTDIFKKVHSSLFAEGTDHTENMGDTMRSNLPQKLFALIREIGEMADSRDVSAFLVGGFVRDLLMGGRNYDLDLVVEGDAVKFGKKLADKLGAALVVHERFGTSTVVNDWPPWLGEPAHADNKFKIDIATARTERYDRPAALPRVQFSSLRKDLYRRDFTVNAMALDINSRDFGLLIDFFNGRKDLGRGIIRVLHDNSFIDDPTRIFRAVRFEQRFGFRIEEHTEYLIKNAVKKEMFKWTENQRIKDELILILKEDMPEKAVMRMKQLHELRFLHPGLRLRSDLGKIYKRLRQETRWYLGNAVCRQEIQIWVMNLMFMLDKLSVQDTDEFLENFIFTRNESNKIRSYSSGAQRIIRKLSSGKKVSPGEIYDVLEGIAHEVLICICSRTSSRRVRSRIRRFLSCYCGVKTEVKGKDLKKLGLKPGPQYNRILKEVLHRKLAGKLKSRSEELGFVKKVITSYKKG